MDVSRGNNESEREREKREGKPDVDNDVRVGPLGEGLGNDRLSAAECAGDCAGAALHAGEERVEHTLAGEQRRVACNLVGDRARAAHRPRVRHGVVVALALKLDLDDVVDDRVVSCRRNPRDLSHASGRQHDAVGDEAVLKDRPKHVPARDVVALLEVRRPELPRLVLVERTCVHALGNENASRELGNVLERPLHAVKDAVHQPGPKLHAQRLPRPQHGVAHRQSARLFVHLNRRSVPLYFSKKKSSSVFKIILK